MRTLIALLLAAMPLAARADLVISTCDDAAAWGKNATLETANLK